MFPAETYVARLDRARARMRDLNVDVLLLSVGADLPYFTGYHAMPLERLTMLVVPSDGDATLVVPQLEAPRVHTPDGVLTLRPWGELENPVDIVAGLMGAATSAAVGDHTWARFVIDLQTACPSVRFSRATPVTSPLRQVKDAAELTRLREAGAAVDRCIEDLAAIRFSGRREVDIERAIRGLLLDHGHETVDFAIVASGPNAASPHHEADTRIISDGETVLCDFGGTLAGYCSDITRVFAVGGSPPGEIADAWAVLQGAQEAGVQAARVGRTAEEVDAAARSLIADAGYGEYFIHRTGHGIGTETHEDPYIVAGNDQQLVAGNAFSVEPGIYVPGQWGLRLEDIVLVSDLGPERVSNASHDLLMVE